MVRKFLIPKNPRQKLKSDILLNVCLFQISIKIFFQITFLFDYDKPNKVINLIKQMNAKLTLGYWGIRGRAQITRLVCAYTGVEWEEKTYTSPEEWFGKDKQQLGILFPNLPYIIDDDLKITESDVLPRYVIKKSGKLQLLGKDPKDMALVDNVIYVIMDLWNPIIQLFFNKRCEDQKAGVFYQLKSKFAKLQKFINSRYTTMEYLTLADFFIAEFSYYVQKLFPQEYLKFKSLQNIRQTIESLDEVRNYYSKPDSVQAVFLPPNMTVIPFYLQKFQPKLPPSAPTMSTSAIKKSEKPKEPIIINNGQKLKIILISGSLRKASTNSGLLRACIQLNNPHIDFEWADISDVPIYNEDIQTNGMPQSVARIRTQVANAHAILFSVSENNSAPTAALKNIYDWLSRGGEKSPIYKIPAGMVSVGGGMGGLRAQKALKLIGEYCQVKFMQNPVVAVKRYEGSYFDEGGNLTDDKIRQNLREYLSALVLWTDKNKRQ